MIDDSHLEKFVGGYDDWLSQHKQLRNLLNQIEKLEANIAIIQQQISQQLEDLNRDLEQKYLLWEELLELE